MGKAYSFKDVVAAIVGPNGSLSLNDGASAEEGISVSQTDDDGTMTIGAGGDGMHSLHAGQPGTVTIRLLKTSKLNALLMDMRNADRSSSALYGQNTISIRDVARGDSITSTDCAFRKVPDLSYAKVGNTVEWGFNAIRVDYKLGNGQPAVL